MTDVLHDATVVGAAAVVLAVAIALAAHLAVFRVLRTLPLAGVADLGRLLAARFWWPSRALVLVTAVDLTLPGVRLRAAIEDPARHALSLILIGSVAWLLVALLAALEDLAIRRFDIQVSDNLKARRIRTQVAVIRRVTVVVVSIVTAAIMLTTFPQARALGASILASAGIAGLVLGIAAQSTLSNLMAGIQIAFTEPIRIDDVVVVQGEWGRIEEITFTYVVVKIWDERRLVLPIGYFTRNPFENWTRSVSQLLGSVHLYVDYTVPMTELRAELERIVQESPRWDGRVMVLQVTNASERGVELRALVSARDSSTAWDLRCEVREKLIEFLQRRYPSSLPRLRAELVGSPQA